jgi:hypothetical protein
VDSLIFHSGYADIRLERYLFTEQAFAYFKWVLKMGGVFATYNYFRQEWAIERKDWGRIAPTTIINEIGTPRFATDDWPFLYLRDRLIPNLSIRPMIVLGLLGVAMVYLFLPKGRGRIRLDGRMFFLGAASMLLETKEVVQLALLFGSTWDHQLFGVLCCAHFSPTGEPVCSEGTVGAALVALYGLLSPLAPASSYRSIYFSAAASCCATSFLACSRLDRCFCRGDLRPVLP